jgi:hypothetical protein
MIGKTTIASASIGLSTRNESVGGKKKKSKQPAALTATTNEATKRPVSDCTITTRRKASTTVALLM